tara:strand:+ start:49488 stop:49706 length:219 start_codon:yes stop_codon:yes gene_type:complete
MSIPKTDALPLGDAPTSRRIYRKLFQYATQILHFLTLGLIALGLLGKQHRNCRISLHLDDKVLSFFDKVDTG